MSFLKNAYLIRQNHFYFPFMFYKEKKKKTATRSCFLTFIGLSHQYICTSVEDKMSEIK